MGWAKGRFPVLSQLNVITNPANIDDTYDFFTGQYGPDGSGYQVGSLASDWAAGGKGTPPPSWEEDEDNPWNKGDADEWRAHCQKSLKMTNQGLDHDGKSTGGTVEDDLRTWIVDAILKKQQIVYRYRRNKSAGADWQADREQKNGRWYITVSGPGF
jgi:hypothetical protein